MATVWGPRQWGRFVAACLLTGFAAAAVADRLIAPSIVAIVTASLQIFGGAA